MPRHDGPWASCDDDTGGQFVVAVLSAGHNSSWEIIEIADDVDGAIVS